MYKPMSYSEIRSRIQTALEDPSDPDRLAVLDTCCRLMAALVLGAETTLMTPVSASQRENLRTLLHHLTVRYPEEICLLRAA